MTIRVFQGEREMAQHNKLLGQFDLVGIPPAPRGVPQIEVTFDIDANGIVSVSAKDKATGKEQQIRIQASGGLSDAEIQKMVKDAEAHAAEDKQRKELVEAKNHAEGMIHSTEKSLAEFGDKVAAADKSAIETAISELKSALEGESKDQIEQKTNALGQVAMKLGEAMYRQSQGEETPPPGAGAGAGPQGSPTTASSMPISRKSRTTTASRPERMKRDRPRAHAGAAGVPRAVLHMQRRNRLNLISIGPGGELIVKAGEAHGQT